MKQVILFYTSRNASENWEKKVQSVFSDFKVEIWPRIENPSDVKYAILWQLPHGNLSVFNNLRLIIVPGFGVDHLLADQSLDPSLPLVRAIDPEAKRMMANYVLTQVLYYEWGMDEYARQQRNSNWRYRYRSSAMTKTVGILGAGQMGAASASLLKSIGFKVLLWKRNGQSDEAAQIFAGMDSLESFARQSDILICLLPLTNETKSILNKNLFNLLPKGAVLINCARGAHLVDDDLIEALESGHMSGATLDVFHTEPLPPESKWWARQDVRITPHCASWNNPDSLLPVARNIVLEAEKGNMPTTINRKLEY